MAVSGPIRHAVANTPDRDLSLGLLLLLKTSRMATTAAARILFLSVLWCCCGSNHILWLKNFFFLLIVSRGRPRRWPRTLAASRCSHRVAHSHAARVGMAGLKSLSLPPPPPFLLRWLLTLLISLGIASTSWRSRLSSSFFFFLARGVYERTNQLRQLEKAGFLFLSPPPHTSFNSLACGQRSRHGALESCVSLSLASISCDVIDR